MKYEPSIDQTHLIGIVRKAYQLPVAELTFVPVGFAATCYVARCGDGTRYFLKVWPDIRLGSARAARQETILYLMRTLYERGIYTRLPYPLPTYDGALWTSCGTAPLAVFPFIVGQPLTTWTPALTDEWARTIAAIHRVTPALADALPPCETFAIPFETDLRRCLELVRHIGSGERPRLQALREALLSRREETMTQLSRLHRLQQVVRRLAGSFVLCHTDMGADNLLLDEHGQLYILDWDEAAFAPPEHDLHEARWIDVQRVFEVYKADGGVHPLHLDHFAFYLLRRFLGDMTARIVRMFEHNTSADEDADALDGIEAWGFAQWDVLDETLENFAAALRRVNR